jgi:hypothetical protein
MKLKTFLAGLTLTAGWLGLVSQHAHAATVMILLMAKEPVQ